MGPMTWIKAILVLHHNHSQQWSPTSPASAPLARGWRIVGEPQKFYLKVFFGTPCRLQNYIFSDIFWGLPLLFTIFVCVDVFDVLRHNLTNSLLFYHYLSNYHEVNVLRHIWPFLLFFDFYVQTSKLNFLQHILGSSPTFYIFCLCWCVCCSPT